MTVEQAMQQAAAAYNAGNVQEAERVYQAILKSQPKHPDANHNLGLIAISESNIAVALPLFKVALEVKPEVEQFWISYIGALVEANQLKFAKRAIKRAKKNGINAKKLQLLLPQKKEKAKGETKELSQAQRKSLLEHYQNGRFKDAEKFATSIIQEFPSDNFSWKVLAAVFKATGRNPEALNASQTAVALAPQDAEAHSNLGVTYQELGRLDEAEASYARAITLKSDYAEAYSNLGITLQELGRLDEAEASYAQAIAFKPDYPEAHSNLGITLQRLGRLDKAVASYAQAIALRPDYAEAYVNLGIAIKNVKFTSLNRELYPPLIQLLTTENFASPIDVAPSILSLLMHDPLIEDLLLEKNFAKGLKEVTRIIGSLDRLTLLHNLMRVCALPDLQFEQLFVAIRSFLLKNLDEMEVSPELIYFLSTLSIHCFVNEYVYAETDEEICQVEELQAQISQTIAQFEQPEATSILCLATYRSLHQYDWCQKIEALDNLEEVKKRLIEEPLLEKIIAKDMPVLGEISDDVSLNVREQYEENPYPRWVKLGVFTKAKPIAKVCDELKLHIYAENIKNVTYPFILIAGCGSGQHSLGTASRFLNCHITAVDLSLASLAYAQRKSNELGCTNIDYMQADILNLHQLGKEFDIIESVGVLHHMSEPMAGWKTLVDLLKPGGLMKIGLYSELARNHIVEVRKEIKLRRVGTSEADIRKFRRSLLKSHDENHQLLTTSSDFFSLSTMRDLIFHVQEHRFTLQQIKNCLDDLGLKFCGFENKVATSSFRAIHRNETDIYDLELWHQYEEKNPGVFSGMYQFWCQKP